MSEELSAMIERYKGRLQSQVSLAPFSWFRTGGKAEWLFMPENQWQLTDFLLRCPDYTPLTVLGLASNVIIRSGGIDGVTIKLGRGFGKIELIEKDKILVGAATPCAFLAKKASSFGIDNLQFYRGIPGSIGGALTMNAGAYGLETKDVLQKACYTIKNGEEKTIDVKEMQYSYRKCGVKKDDMIFTAAVLQGKNVGDKKSLEKKMQQYMQQREETQPIKQKTGGSTFKNPPGKKAWKLIEQAGCRNMKYNGAQISSLHCNFMINNGNATSSDLENLADEVQKRVLENSGIKLELEIKCIGKKTEE